MKRVDVFLTGRVLRSTEVETVAARLSALAGIDETLALQLVSCRRLIRIKKGTDADVALRYRRALTAIGAEVLLQPVRVVPVSNHAAPLSPASKKSCLPIRQGGASPAIPRLGPLPSLSPLSTVAPIALQVDTATFLGQLRLVSRPMQSMGAVFAQIFGRTLNRGLAAPLPQGPKTRRSTEWLSSPRVVPAQQGWEWLRQSWLMFTEQLTHWLLLFFLTCCLLSMVFLAPDAHIFLLLLTLPVLLGILVAAAHQQSLEEPSHLLHPLAAAAKSWKALFIFGLFSLLFMLFTGAGFFFLAGLGLFNGEMYLAPLAAWHSDLPLTFAGIMVLLLFALPLLSGYLFTIPLVLLAEFRPVHAYQLGVYGCIRNWRAVLVAFVICAPVLMLTAALLSAIQWLLPWLFWPLSTVILFSLIPPMAVMGILLVYNAFRDIFAIGP